MRLRVFFGFFVAAMLFSVAAQAYPQWQFSSGTSRCNQCHFSPAGGGLVTSYGRDAAGEELSTWTGDGAFLHGAVELPTWLALGLDARGALLRHDAGNSDGPTTAAFPMQADAHARAVRGEYSLAFTVGYRGQARTTAGPIGADNFEPAAGSRFISREHYLMWRAGALGPYVRLGRFFAPYGLRLAEHTTYVRRDLGFNLLQESYGASFGIVRSQWELHLTGFIPDFVRDMGGRDTGVAGLVERRFDNLAVGLSARGGSNENFRRIQGGPFGRLYLERLKTLLMVEASIVNWEGTSGAKSNQLVGYAGATVFPLRGLWLGVYGEVSQTDIEVKATATRAINGQINWFPYPHFELSLLGRLQEPEGQDAAQTLLLQLHYYL